TCRFQSSCCSISTPVVGLMPIVAPFFRIPQHVEQPQVVGHHQTARPGLILAIASVPGIPPQQVDRLTVIPATARPAAACILPFRLGGQAVTPALENIGGDLHPLVVLSLIVRQVAPLVLGQALLLAEPVAVSRGAKPFHTDDRTIRLGTVLFQTYLIRFELLV